MSLCLCGSFLNLLFAAEAKAEPAIERYPNGFTVIMEHREGAPVTAVQLWVKAGSVDEEEKTVGLSHFLEHMLFKGTATRPVGSVHEDIEKNGGEINAATSDDWTYYHISILSEEWLRAAEIILDISTNASLPTEEIEREREVVKEEIARRDDNPMTALYDMLGTAAYREHPYRFRTIGDSATLALIKRPELLEYYQKFYIPGNMAFVIVGDFDTSALSNRIANSLGSALSKKRPESNWSVEKPAGRSPVEKSMNAALLYGAVTWPAPAASSLSENVAGDLLVELIAGDGIGRLSKTLVEERRWADDISVSFPTSRDPGRFTVIYTADPSRRELITREIRREMKRLIVDGVTQKELDEVRDRLRLTRVLDRQSTSSRAFSLGFWYAVARPEYEAAYDRMLELITPDDLEYFAEKYFPDELGIEAALLPIGAESKSVESDAAASKIIFKSSTEPLGSIGIFISGGQSVEPEPGWSTLLAGTMSRGVEGKKHEAFTRELASIGLTAGASSHEDMISLIGTAEPAKLALLADLLFDMALTPNYEEMNVVRENLLADLRSREDRPFNIAYDRLNSERWGGHPYGEYSSGRVESLKRADAESLEKFRASIIDGSSIKIVVVGAKGDTSPLASLVARRLEGIVGSPPAAGELPRGKSGIVAIPAEKAQTMLLWSVEAPSILDGDYAVWKVANAVLGGRSSSRLFRVIREERGLAYAVGSFYPSRKLGSQFVVYAGTRPGTANEVRGLFGEVFGPASAEELADAKRLIKGEFALDHEEVTRRVYYLGWYETLGLGAGFDSEYPRRIEAVTLDEVNRVIAGLGSAPTIEVTYGPSAGDEK